MLPVVGNSNREIFIMKFNFKFVAGFLCCLLVGMLAACGTPAGNDGEDLNENLPTVAPSQEQEEVPEESESVPPAQESMIIDVAVETQQVTNHENKGDASFGGSWPKNEFTKYLPQLNAGKISMSLTQDCSFELLASDLSLDEVKEYVDAVAEKGFSIDADRKDYAESGIEAYTYAAKHKDGYAINLSYSVGLLSISVEKTK
jgi:hypothetical protein